MTTGSWDSSISADDRPTAGPPDGGPLTPEMPFHLEDPDEPRIGVTTSADAAFRNPFHLMHRDVPVAIYLSQDGVHHMVQALVEDLLDTLDLDVTRRGPEITGSWFRAMTARTRSKVAGSELQDRLRKLERGIELHALYKAQAEVDEKQGSTVAQLLTALEHTPTALIQIGSLLIVKVDGVPAVRNLTQLELRHLEQNPQLLGDPGAVLEALQRQSSSGTLASNASNAG
jgi:BMFP domain-containing protein YqiC